MYLQHHLTIYFEPSFWTCCEKVWTAITETHTKVNPIDELVFCLSNTKKLVWDEYVVAQQMIWSLFPVTATWQLQLSALGFSTYISVRWMLNTWANYKFLMSTDTRFYSCIQLSSYTDLGLFILFQSSFIWILCVQLLCNPCKQHSDVKRNEPTYTSSDRIPPKSSQLMLVHWKVQPHLLLYALCTCHRRTRIIRRDSKTSFSWFYEDIMYFTRALMSHPTPGVYKISTAYSNPSKSIVLIDFIWAFCDVWIFLLSFLFQYCALSVYL